MEKIEITRNDEGLFTVRQGDRWSDKMQDNEMLGIIISLTFTQPEDYLSWMRTKSQHIAHNKRMDAL